MSTKQLVQPTQGDTLFEVMGYATALCSAPCSAGNSVVSSTGRLSSAGAQQLNWKEGGRVPWI
jgi:hypothetical protein